MKAIHILMITAIIFLLASCRSGSQNNPCDCEAVRNAVIDSMMAETVGTDTLHSEILEINH